MLSGEVRSAKRLCRAAARGRDLMAKRSTDTSDQINRRPSLLADVLARGRGRLAEGAGDLIGEADRPGDRERHVTGWARQRAGPEPGGLLRGPQLHARSAELVVALGVWRRGWIEEQPHALIIALATGRPKPRRRREPSAV